MPSDRPPGPIAEEEDRRGGRGAGASGRGVLEPWNENGWLKFLVDRHNYDYGDWHHWYF
jgi:hypothetical protein